MTIKTKQDNKGAEFEMLYRKIGLISLTSQREGVVEGQKTEEPNVMCRTILALDSNKPTIKQLLRQLRTFD
jgi:hypothetical protein